MKFIFTYLLLVFLLILNSTRFKKYASITFKFVRCHREEECLLVGMQFYLWRRTVENVYDTSEKIYMYISRFLRETNYAPSCQSGAYIFNNVLYLENCFGHFVIYEIAAYRFVYIKNISRADSLDSQKYSMIKFK